METVLADFIKDTPAGRTAEGILRKCVHCGFCAATCPTYQLLGDELDGPRGRIYLMKQMLEGQPVSARTRRHLDRCLTCRACETTCPSGVEYGRLLDVGRELVEQRVGRSMPDRIVRWGLRRLVAHEGRFRTLAALGRLVRPLLPAALRSTVPRRRPDAPWPSPRHGRRMLVLRGCVQPTLAPGINVAAARLLDAHGVTLIEVPGSGCCGALPAHLSAPEEARVLMRRNVDAWWPHVEAGAEALVMTASGCGVLVKDYAHWLGDEPAYAARARRLSAITRDLVEVVGELDVEAGSRAGEPSRVAVHTPCTLQHGQGLAGAVEDILLRSGHSLARVGNPHLCCGSAGSYSILQPALSRRLRDSKLRDLTRDAPDAIVTANVGCLHHLESASPVPVRHWIELVSPPGADDCSRPAPRNNAG